MITTPHRKRHLVLLAASLVVRMVMIMHPLPTLAQANKTGEEMTMAQVGEKKKPEEKTPEQQKTNQQRSAPQTGSILVGIAVGALLVAGGFLARSTIAVGAAPSEEGGYVDVVRRVVLRPVEFFAGLPRGVNLLNPLLFALICLEISAVLGWLLALIGGQNSPGFNPNPQNLGFPPSSVLLPPYCR